MKSMELTAGCEPRCTACPHREFTRDKSESQKQNWVAHHLAPWTDVLAPLHSVPDDRRWNYRQKSVLRSVWSETQHTWEFGVLDRDRNLIPIPDCPVHTARVRGVYKTLAAHLPRPSAVDLPLHFVSIVGRQACLVVKSHRLADTAWIPELWKKLEADLDGLWVNCNPAAGERVFAHQGWQLAAGRAHSEVELLGETFEHGPSSFMQLIPELYSDALKQSEAFFDLHPNSAVLDLYSGIGVSLTLWKKHTAHVLGVELHGESLQFAQKRADCLRGRVEDRIPQMNDWVAEQKQKQREIFVFANPPRAGMHPAVVNWLAERVVPRRIAYLSCHVPTLSRDLTQLKSLRPYLVDNLQAYDFFPQTRQVETLARLEIHPLT